MAQEQIEKVDQDRPKRKIPLERIFATIAITSSFATVFAFLFDPVRKENLKLFDSYYEGTPTILTYYGLLTTFLCALGCLIVLYLYRCSKVLKKGRHMKTEFPRKHKWIWVHWVIFIPALSKKLWYLLAILTGTPAYGTSCVKAHERTLFDWFDFSLGLQIHTATIILLIISFANIVPYCILKYSNKAHNKNLCNYSVSNHRVVFFHQALLILSILGLHVVSAYDPVHRHMFLYGIFYCLEFGTRQVTSYSEAPLFIIAYILVFCVFVYAVYALITSFTKKYFR
jgi:hypothetical protein